MLPAEREPVGEPEERTGGVFRTVTETEEEVVVLSLLSVATADKE